MEVEVGWRCGGAGVEVEVVEDVGWRCGGSGATLGWRWGRGRDVAGWVVGREGGRRDGGESLPGVGGRPRGSGGGQATAAAE